MPPASAVTPAAARRGRGRGGGRVRPVVTDRRRLPSRARLGTDGERMSSLVIGAFASARPLPWLFLFWRRAASRAFSLAARIIHVQQRRSRRCCRAVRAIGTDTYVAAPALCQRGRRSMGAPRRALLSPPHSHTHTPPSANSRRQAPPTLGLHTTYKVYMRPLLRRMRSFTTAHPPPYLSASIKKDNLALIYQRAESRYFV